MLVGRTFCHVGSLRAHILPLPSVCKLSLTEWLCKQGACASWRGSGERNDTRILSWTSFLEHSVSRTSCVDSVTLSLFLSAVVCASVSAGKVCCVSNLTTRLRSCCSLETALTGARLSPHLCRMLWPEKEQRCARENETLQQQLSWSGSEMRSWPSELEPIADGKTLCCSSAHISVCAIRLESVLSWTGFWEGPEEE